MAQSVLVWTVISKAGKVRAAIRWCACGGVMYPGSIGRWLGRNLRRTYYGAQLPAWHRAMGDLTSGPASVYAPIHTPADHPPQPIVWPAQEPDAA